MLGIYSFLFFACGMICLTFKHFRTAYMKRPSLSSRGWLTDIIDVTDHLLATFIVTDYSQSNCFYKQLHSLPWLVANYQDRPSELAEHVETTLESLFSPYFERAEIKAKVVNVEGSEYGIDVHLTIYKDGKVYDLTKAFELKSGLFQLVATRNNEGDV